MVLSNGLDVYGTGYQTMVRPRLVHVLSISPELSRTAMYSIAGRKLGGAGLRANGNGLYLSSSIVAGVSIIKPVVRVK